jgi:hypothetical protein
MFGASVKSPLTTKIGGTGMESPPELRMRARLCSPTDTAHQAGGFRGLLGYRSLHAVCGDRTFQTASKSQFA